MPRPEYIKGMRRVCIFVTYSATQTSAQIVRQQGSTRELTRKGSVLAMDQRSRRSVPPDPTTGHPRWWFYDSTEQLTLRFHQPLSQGLLAGGMRLRFCDSTEQLTLQCSASERGFGAALLQHGAPHAFPSRALTAAETRDAQNEKVMQAAANASSRSVSRTTSRYSPP